MRVCEEGGRRGAWIREQRPGREGLRVRLRGRDSLEGNRDAITHFGKRVTSPEWYLLKDLYLYCVRKSRKRSIEETGRLADRLLLQTWQGGRRPRVEATAQQGSRLSPRHPAVPLDVLLGAGLFPQHHYPPSGDRRALLSARVWHSLSCSVLQLDSM